MDANIRTDFHELVRPILGLAESLIAKEGEFKPFGARVGASGGLAVVDVSPTLRDPSNPLIIDALYAEFRVEAKAGAIRACAVCWDAMVPRLEGGGMMDAIAIGLEHRDGEPSVVLYGYERELNGEIRFDYPVTAAGKRHVFGHVLFC
jgi:hypothetical protein